MKDNAKLTKTETPSLKAYVVPGSVIFMIISLGSFWLIYRRKHN
jgi:hypothetical protein